MIVRRGGSVAELAAGPRSGSLWRSPALMLLLAMLCGCGLGVMALRPAAAAAATTGPPVRAKLITRSGRLRLQIRRGTATVFNGPVRSSVCGSDCQTAALAPGRSPLRALELSGGRAAVLVGLFSGGAHCCFSDELYVVDPARDAVRHSELDLLDDQPTLIRYGTGWALRGADARLAEEYFTDFAHSGAPFAAWSLTPQGFVSITRRFRAALASDAARWWRSFRANPSNDVGFIAAWAADEDQLGHESLVAQTLAQEARAGHLTSSLAGPGHTGASFVAALQKSLRALGDTRR